MAYIGKYSTAGGLNPFYVEEECRKHDEDVKVNYIARASEVAAKNIAKAFSNANTNMNCNNNGSKGYYNNNKPRKLKLEDELEIKLNFLKKHSDGSETEYEMAKHVLGI